MYEHAASAHRKRVSIAKNRLMAFEKKRLDKNASYDYVVLGRMKQFECRRCRADCR
jgi:hypothetical protein